MDIELKEGSLNVLEPVMWYLRLRAYVRASASCCLEPTDYCALVVATARKIMVFELGGLALVVMGSVCTLATLYERD